MTLAVNVLKKYLLVVDQKQIAHDVCMYKLKSIYI